MQKIFLNDPMITLDLKIHNNIIRFIFIYFPHANYELIYFHYNFIDIEGLFKDAADKRYAIIM